jgi:hypothetical protein
MPTSHRTELSAGNLNGSARLVVELIEPAELPPVIRIKWPERPTVIPPAQFDAAVAAAMRILSNAVVELAAIRVRKKKL